MNTPYRHPPPGGDPLDDLTAVLIVAVVLAIAAVAAVVWISLY